MKKEESLVWGKASLFLSALLMSQVFLSSAFASSNGSVTSSTACSVCHGLDATTVMILGPAEVQAHETNTYTVEISGSGPGVQGGFDVATLDGGVLGLIDAGTQGTQLVADSTSGLNEVTHDGPKAFSSSTVSWLFTWTAPGDVGAYDLFGQVVNGNDGQGAGGDFTGMTTFTVDVVAVPIPAAWVLFGSALGLLGWLRRKIA